ncbi:cyclic nucleotide-binding domain-containing protein [Candidatus Gracilibacteria bacterium]|nr:cyclic nucleotide-binding domain-containing protein [Candidatus Gracilibacteria bacterium]
MNYFKDIELFSDLSEIDQIQLSNFCQVQKISTGELLFSQGDEPQAMYVILSGEMIVKKESHGEERNVATLGTGDLVGEMAFFGEPPLRTASVVANGDVVVLVVIRFSVEMMMQKYPDLYERVKFVIEERST